MLNTESYAAHVPADTASTGDTVEIVRTTLTLKSVPLPATDLSAKTASTGEPITPAGIVAAGLGV